MSTYINLSKKISELTQKTIFLRDVAKSQYTGGSKKLSFKKAKKYIKNKMNYIKNYYF